jgi:hypothetical protein
MQVDAKLKLLEDLTEIVENIDYARGAFPGLACSQSILTLHHKLAFIIRSLYQACRGCFSAISICSSGALQDANREA